MAAKKPSEHWPYKYCPRTGQGPRGGSSVKRDKWSCTCAKQKKRPDYKGSWSKCTCTQTETGRTRVIWNSLDYKNGPRGYNKEYKAWVKEVRNRKRICRRPDKKDYPRQGSGLPRPTHVRPLTRLRIKMVTKRRGHN